MTFRIKFLGITALALMVTFPFTRPVTATPQDSATQQTKKKAKDATKDTSDAAKDATQAAVTQADIQAAKASGKVWVNTSSGVYHKGGKNYGATKQGKFMTEQEAIKEGYRPAKNEKTEKE